MKPIQKTLAILLCIALVCSLAACGGRKTVKKPWLHSGGTNSKAGTSSYVTGGGAEGSDGAPSSAPNSESSAISVPSSALEAEEASEEDKEQSIHWNGVGTNFYHQSISSKYAVEAWINAIEQNPKNISPYLHIANVALAPETGGLTIPEYTGIMKRLYRSCLSSKLESVSLSDEEATITLDFDQAANSLVLTYDRSSTRYRTLTLLFEKSGNIEKYMREEGNIHQTYAFEYDEKGQLVSVVEKAEGLPTPYNEYAYSYNESGQLIKKLHYDENGKPDYETTYEYNIDGTLAREYYPTTMDDGTPTVRETVYTYDAQGRIVQESYGYEGMESDSVYTYQYDANGNIVESNRINSDKENDSTTVYTFDSRGWLCAINWGDSEESLTLDEYGNRVKEEEENTYDASGNPTHAWGYEINYTFAN